MSLAESDPTGSPCIGVCKMDPQTQLCAGCFRTIGEIASWSLYSDAEKRAVRRELDQRKTSPPYSGHDRRN